MIRALTCAALSVLITCSSAHGASTSHSSSSSSSFEIASAPANPASVPCSDLCASTAGISSPFGACRPVVESETAITTAPSSASMRARCARRCRSPAPRREAGRRLALLLERVGDHVKRAACGRLLASERAADRQRLARHHAEHRVALVHRVGVEDPGHHARVGAHVGGRDVLLGPDLVDDLAREAAGHALELPPREPLRIADDASLGASEREPHQRALPGHPHRKRLDLVGRDVRVIADAALRRAAGDVVRDAVALEHGHGAVVHRDRNRDLDGLLAPLENVDQVRIDRERLTDAPQLFARDRVRIFAQVGRRLRRRHAAPPGSCSSWRAGVYASGRVRSADPEPDDLGL